jgi:hypothetical protein
VLSPRDSSALRANRYSTSSESFGSAARTFEGFVESGWCVGYTGFARERRGPTSRLDASADPKSERGLA